MRWKSIENYPNYLVSDTGLVKNCVTGNIKFQGYGKNFNEYKIVQLWKNNVAKQFQVHRLVAQAFIPNPYNLPQVNHKDGNKLNNCVDNLEWCDNSYNQKHAYTNGLQKPHGPGICGEQIGTSKLTWDIIHTIRELYRNNPDISRKELGSRYGVHPDTITRIIYNKCWKECKEET